MKRVTFNIYYTGKNGGARQFAKEMLETGIVKEIKAQQGNLRYEYFYPVDDEETVLLIDSWENQRALDLHHSSPVMQKIISLRQKYELTMKVERYISNNEDISENDKRYMIR